MQGLIMLRPRARIDYNVVSLYLTVLYTTYYSLK